MKGRNRTACSIQREGYQVPNLGLGGFKSAISIRSEGDGPRSSMDTRSHSAFLRDVWSSPCMGTESEDERYQLSQKTIRAMAGYVYGGWRCLQCKRGLGTPSGQIEGHHVSKGTAYISRYKHLKYRKSRQRALTTLWSEMALHVVLLCKSCHEKAHHYSAGSVKYGLDAVHFSVYGQCTKKPCASRTLLQTAMYSTTRRRW